jgi:plastocyanin
VRPAVVAITACCSLVLVSACGSSGTSSTTASSTPSPASAPTVKLDSTPAYAPPSASTPVLGGVVQVAYRNFGVAPDTLRVRLGTTVRWTNFDSAAHNVTSESGPQHFASSSLRENETFDVKLTTPGTIHYESTTQPATMNGTIEVVK